MEDFLFFGVFFVKFSNVGAQILHTFHVLILGDCNLSTKELQIQQTFVPTYPQLLTAKPNMVVLIQNALKTTNIGYKIVQFLQI